MKHSLVEDYILGVLRRFETPMTGTEIIKAVQGYYQSGHNGGEIGAGIKRLWEKDMLYIKHDFGPRGGRGYSTLPINYELNTRKSYKDPVVIN